MDTGLVGSVLPSVLRRRKAEDGVASEKSLLEDGAPSDRSAQHCRSQNSNSDHSEVDETTKSGSNDADDGSTTGSQSQMAPTVGDDAIDEKVNRIVQQILENSSVTELKKSKGSNGVRKSAKTPQGVQRKRSSKSTDSVPEKEKRSSKGNSKTAKTANAIQRDGSLDQDSVIENGNNDKVDGKVEKSSAKKKKKTESEGPRPKSGGKRARKTKNDKNAPLSLFPRIATLTRNWCIENRFEVGMCVESIDPQRPAAYCPFVITDKKSIRIRLHYTDYNCEYFDFWVPFYSPLVFPVGFCSSTGRTLCSRTTKDRSSSTFDWQRYFEKHPEHRPSPPRCFAACLRQESAPGSASTSSTGENSARFRVGMKLEALDKRNPNMYGVATIRDVLELELTNVPNESEGASQSNGPTEAESSKINQDEEQAPVDKVADGEKVSAESNESTSNTDPNGESTSISDKPIGAVETRAITYLLVHFDGWPDEYEHWCDASSASVRWCGFCAERGELLCLPSEWPQHITFDWPQYLKRTNSVAAPRLAFDYAESDPSCDYTASSSARFEVGMRLCAVDRRNPLMIRYATIRSVESHKLLLRFEDFDEPPVVVTCPVHSAGAGSDANQESSDMYGYPEGLECLCPSDEDDAEREERSARFDFWVDEDSLDIIPVEFAQRASVYVVKPMTADERATQRHLAQLKSGDAIAPQESESNAADGDEERAKQRKPWANRCLTPGCRGRGHLNGYTAKHVTETMCPYTSANTSKTQPLFDRFEFDRALEKYAADTNQQIDQITESTIVNDFVDRYFARATADEPPPPPPSGFTPFAFRQLSQSSDRSATGRAGKLTPKSLLKPSLNSRPPVKGSPLLGSKPISNVLATPGQAVAPSAAATASSSAVVNGRKKMEEAAAKSAQSKKRPLQCDSDSEASQTQLVSRSRSASPSPQSHVAGESNQFKTPLPPKRGRPSADADVKSFDLCETDRNGLSLPDAASLRSLKRDEASVNSLLGAVGVVSTLLSVGVKAHAGDLGTAAARLLTPTSAEMWRQQVLKLTSVDLRELRSHLDTSVLLWNREQLIIFVVQITNQRDAAASIRRAFDEHCIDPASFLLLHYTDLTNIMRLRVGVALKIFACVQYLRGEIAQLPGDTLTATSR